VALPPQNAVNTVLWRVLVQETNLLFPAGKKPGDKKLKEAFYQERYYCTKLSCCNQDSISKDFLFFRHLQRLHSFLQAILTGQRKRRAET